MVIMLNFAILWSSSIPYDQQRSGYMDVLSDGELGRGGGVAAAIRRQEKKGQNSEISVGENMNPCVKI